MPSTSDTSNFLEEISPSTLLRTCPLGAVLMLWRCATTPEHRLVINDNLVIYVISCAGAMEGEFSRLETETKNVFRAARRIARNAGAEEFNMAKLLGETRQEELSRAMAAEHRAYVKATAARVDVRYRSTRSWTESRLHAVAACGPACWRLLA